MRSGGLSSFIARRFGRQPVASAAKQGGDDGERVLQLWPFAADRLEIDRDDLIVGDVPFVDPALVASLRASALPLCHAPIFLESNAGGDSHARENWERRARQVAP